MKKIIRLSDVVKPESVDELAQKLGGLVSPEFAAEIGDLKKVVESALGNAQVEVDIPRSTKIVEPYANLLLVGDGRYCVSKEFHQQMVNGVTKVLAIGYARETERQFAFAGTNLASTNHASWSENPFIENYHICEYSVQDVVNHVWNSDCSYYFDQNLSALGKVNWRFAGMMLVGNELKDAKSIGELIQGFEEKGNRFGIVFHGKELPWNMKPLEEVADVYVVPDVNDVASVIVNYGKFLMFGGELPEYKPGGKDAPSNQKRNFSLLSFPSQFSADKRQ